MISMVIIAGEIYCPVCNNLLCNSIGCIVFGLLVTLACNHADDDMLYVAIHAGNPPDKASNTL